MEKVYRNAIVEYKKVLQTDPTNAQMFFNLSTAYNGLNQGQNAVLCARKAQELFGKKNDGAGEAKARKRLRELYKTYNIKPEE
ncbi:MAG: hypothetical protein COV67_13920 [Nitrospinae bacterium CG11_big_fil_rev_8_21_14_0_20_56_8]|nr:MAG: hypothetical protein COV67_13920 [Nitrospinae bacterium CG11_big_fil_rev_8_21_14_0_20_56_8]